LRQEDKKVDGIPVHPVGDPGRVLVPESPMLQQLMANHVLWVALLASVLAQAIKLILAYVRSGKLNLRVLVETGGMPSSHAALVTALSVGVGLEEGWDSLLFAATMVFALVVMYDAARDPSGCRQAGAGAEPPHGKNGLRKKVQIASRSPT
jgi:Uncharacterized protein conserved in bacteria